MKKLGLFPGRVAIEGKGGNTVEFELKSALLSQALKENQISIEAAGRELLRVKIDDEVIIIGQKLARAEKLELITVIAPHEDIGRFPPVARISEKNMARLGLYENNVVILESAKVRLKAMVKEGREVNDEQISLCREVRDKLGISLGETILIRGESEKEKTAHFLEVLKKIDFMEAFKEEELKKLAKRLKKEEFRGGEVICRENEEGDSMYVIDSGKVEVSIQSQLGTKHIITYLKKGDFFGEISLLTGQKRTATVTGVTYGELLVIDKNSFRNILMIDPTRVEKIADIVGRRIKETKKYIKAAEAKDQESLKKAKATLSFAAQIRDFFALDEEG
jgi:CRP-like cAMP-binding protein